LLIQRADARDFSTKPRREIALAAAEGYLRFVRQLDVGNEQPRIAPRRGVLIGRLFASAGRGRGRARVLRKRARRFDGHERFQALRREARQDFNRFQVQGSTLRGAPGLPTLSRDGFDGRGSMFLACIGIQDRDHLAADLDRHGHTAPARRQLRKNRSTMAAVWPWRRDRRAFGGLRDDTGVFARDIERIAGLERRIEAHEAPAVKTIAAHQQHAGAGGFFAGAMDERIEDLTERSRAAERADPFGEPSGCLAAFGGGLIRASGSGLLIQTSGGGGLIGPREGGSLIRASRDVLILPSRGSLLLRANPGR
jgi:hypothetical protein